MVPAYLECFHPFLAILSNKHIYIIIKYQPMVFEWRRNLQKENNQDFIWTVIPKTYSYSMSKNQFPWKFHLWFVSEQNVCDHTALTNVKKIFI